MIEEAEQARDEEIEKCEAGVPEPVEGEAEEEGHEEKAEEEGHEENAEEAEEQQVGLKGLTETLIGEIRNRSFILINWYK